MILLQHALTAMRRSSIIVIALFSGLVSADEPPVPPDAQGYWVPATASCKSELGVIVGATSVEFRNKQNRRLIKTKACFSCEGGARYSGIVIWVTGDEPNGEDFTLYLNAREHQGVAKAELDNAKLRSAFPLNDVALRRCKS